MDVNTATQKSQEYQKWAQVDPFTLVQAAESSLFEISSNERSKLEGPISEVIRRFGQQSRAALGSTLSQQQQS